MRGYVAWLATKVSVLIFAVAIFSAFIVFLAMEQNFERLDGLAKAAEGLCQTIDTLAASPYPAEAFVDLKGIDKIAANASGRYIAVSSGANTVERAVVSRLTNASLDGPQRVRLNTSNGLVEITKWS
jgi:hypothetical protein